MKFESLEQTCYSENVDEAIWKRKNSLLSGGDHTGIPHMLKKTRQLIQEKDYSISLNSEDARHVITDYAKTQKSKCNWFQQLLATDYKSSLLCAFYDFLNEHIPWKQMDYGILEPRAVDYLFKHLELDFKNQFPRSNLLRFKAETATCTGEGLIFRGFIANNCSCDVLVNKSK
ncbi:hypothetical protein BdWA1_002782 [Babesia duncani]|uniref:Uncharacterized protein n=1 Tax=Babesia duncani TaxID=323732 RepID=A0AAD9UNT4_9APIC|nr:hypothetical protein BdWA1_002782 [Babesia duncani]